ncbi:hypothetical protein KVT40_006923 [Elsinoe batatas]|uniref:Uncharacterized protein n=1 Tax=Elsinoe batatas TaxID=2601811 RepID=A0A8K0PE27_9PEZI|nr:hypothetical protein KVT40_006923 [Elsinoe batatas]
MASITCQLKIRNKYLPCKFFLFQEVQIQNNLSSEVHNNAYVVSPKSLAASDGSSTVTFEMNNTFHAVFGVKKSQAGVSRVMTTSHRKIALGPGGSGIGVGGCDSELKWDDTAVTGRRSTEPGGFRIITDKSIPVDKDTDFIGVGAAEPMNADNVVPTATFAVESSVNTVIFPKMIYYVATGDMQPGQIIDRSALGPFVKVSFEECSVPRALIVIQKDGTWADNDNESLNNGISITPYNQG